MRYYWVLDRVFQGYFHIYWKPSTKNYGDYFTKHFAHTHHRKIRPTYLINTESAHVRYNQ